MTASGPVSRRRRPRRRRRPFARFVRILLVTSLVLALSVILAWQLRLGTPSGAGEDAAAARDRQRIEKPVYTTRLGTGARLTFSAAYAIPHVTEPSTASLRHVDITGYSGDGHPFHATSDRGTLRVEAGRLLMSGNVRAVGPRGEQFAGEAVTVDTTTDSAWSDTAVHILWGRVELVAGAMAVRSTAGGLEAEFSGGVRMVYRGAGGGE